MDMLIKKTSLPGLFTLLFIFCSPLYALPVTVLSVGADWTEVQPADEFSDVSYFDDDGIVGNEEIRWGFPATDAGQSGYLFEGAAPDAFTVETGDIFSLGDFSHTNQPVWGSISGAQLNITLGLMVNGSLLDEGPFSFSFLHDETNNLCDPQPECANDLVSFASLTVTDIFSVDGIDYTLDLIGFSVDGVFTTQFSTLEGRMNTAQLLGTFTVAQSVPEPPAILLMMLGWLGILLSRKPQQTSI